MIHLVRFTFIPDVIEVGDSEVTAVCRDLGLEPRPLEELLENREFLAYLRDYLILRPEIDTAEVIPLEEDDE